MENSELRELLAKATPGELIATLLNDWTDSSYVETGDGELEFCSGSSFTQDRCVELQPRIHALIELIAAAVNELPRLLADSDALQKLRAEIAGLAVVPITRQVDFTGGIPISWDDHRFETTYAKLLPCDAAGNLLRLPAGEGRE